VTDKKSIFHRKVFGGTSQISQNIISFGRSKSDLPKLRFMAVAAILLGFSNFPNLYTHSAQNSYCQFSSNNSHHCLTIHARMSSSFPPDATSSLNIPVQLPTPPALPSLGDCFPHVSVNLGKYFLYSSALSRRARWRTSLAMWLGGAGESSFGIGYVADDDVDVDASDSLPRPLALLRRWWLEGRSEARRASHECRAKIII